MHHFKSKLRQFLPYILLSLLLHVLAVIFFKSPEFDPSKELQAESPIWIDLKNNKYDIADIAKPKVEERPDDPRFLGVYDSKVKEQQVAERQGRKENTGEKTEDRRQKTEDRKQKTEKEFEKLEKSDSGIVAMREPKKKPQRSFDEGSPGEAPPDDFYPDFKRGNRTYLNVLRFPEVAYFVRLKRAFKLTFDPYSPLREAYYANQISRGNIETVLGVSVDAQGNLAELFVFRSSGIESYDRETLRTIKASSPFSAPPQKLLDKDGVVRMSWTFTVYL
ncbi:MAG: TonB family protein [Deltaproteobacteria bacterium]|nr:TonB family protein [Deltaproteobacteria bacterium]